MADQLREALHQTLEGWQNDLSPAWRQCLGDIDLDFDAVDGTLALEPWEPIFPSRRGKVFPGAPAGAHMLRAFDAPAPGDVACVVLGQDPYPCPAFSTGRAFEAGNTARWRELDKMFSKSVRAFIQLIVAARSGNSVYAQTFGAWPTTLAAIEDGTVDLEPPDRLADRWAASGVLLLNSALTLSRFTVEIDPHQSRGHLIVWRPLLVAALRYLRDCGRPMVYLGFGDVAADTLARAGLAPGQAPNRQRVVLRAHPAAAAEVLAADNPFVACNRHLRAVGGVPVDW